MKKTLVAAAALIALPVMAQAQTPTSGFYIGAEGGLNWLLNTTVTGQQVGSSGQQFQIGVQPQTGFAVGGVIGVVIGSGIALLLHFFFPSMLSALWVALAFCCSCGIGLLFGIYPAWKAANLNPIDALRYE